MSIDKKQLSKLVYYMTTFDGGVYKSGKNHSFIMNMKKDNSDYLEFVKSTLENITSVQMKEQPDYNKDGFNRRPLVRLWSKSHPYFNSIRDRVYIDNHKVIDPHMLTLMDAEALAIIFMTDGSSNLDKRWTNPHCSITLCTKGFSYADNLILSKAIYEHCGIRTSVIRHYQYWYLNVKTADHQKFVDTVKPYTLPSFNYKLERIAPALEYRLGGDIV
jgi:hypothetical protein